MLSMSPSCDRKKTLHAFIQKYFCFQSQTLLTDLAKVTLLKANCVYDFSILALVEISCFQTVKLNLMVLGEPFIT